MTNFADKNMVGKVLTDSFGHPIILILGVANDNVDYDCWQYSPEKRKTIQADILEDYIAANNLTAVDNFVLEQRYNQEKDELIDILAVMDGGVTAVRVGGSLKFMATKELNVDWMDEIVDTAIPLIHGIPYKTWHSFEALEHDIVREPGDIFNESLEDKNVLIDIDKRLLKAAERFGFFLWINRIEFGSVMGDIFVEKEDDKYWLVRSYDGAKVFNILELAKDWKRQVLADIDYYEHCYDSYEPSDLGPEEIYL